MFFHSKPLFMAIFVLIIAIYFNYFSDKNIKKISKRHVIYTRNYSNKLAWPSMDGQLHVEGSSLVNSKGDKVYLKGLSTYGLRWYPDYVNKELFTFLANEWDINVIRLALYSEDYRDKQKENLEVLYRGIKAAIDSDIYVVVDWHILNDNSPMINVDYAKEFFDMISNKYANIPNIIYEICNEPNNGVTWNTIIEYSNIIIPIIRKHSPNAMIIVGTPDYSHDLLSPLDKKLDFENVMYAFHFYTSSHHDDMMKILNTAIKKELPVFVSECGITMEDGDGDIDYNYAVKWFTILNRESISYIIWNLSNKKESSSIIKASSGAYKKLSDKDLTDTGKWVRSLLKSTDPKDIPTGNFNHKYSFWESIFILIYNLGHEGLKSINYYPLILICCIGVLLLFGLIILSYNNYSIKKCWTYDQFIKKHGLGDIKVHNLFVKRLLIIALMLISLIYLTWRVVFSINTKNGPLPIICNILLLAVEMLGFIESCILYFNLLNLKKHPLPIIDNEEYPDVDIFIATYNEPEELLKKTINGCKYLDYPDKSKIHVWVCDDKQRSNIRQLATDMNVGYFDRPDNKGAKAGNLNNAMAHTSSPYVVTLDADMIVQSNFLLKTIPYFIYIEKCNKNLPDDQQRHLGLLQTPQCFYDPDVFQFNLYSETKVPNEQDFFYRTIEVGKTSTNSVIYGGSNTVLSRHAIEDIGGFYKESITEDFATGLLIETKGYLSLAIEEPLASGMTPNNFDDHIKQRTRWGRGVINTAKKIKLLWRFDLFFPQKLSYLSSVVYWYSPIKNLIYIVSPLFYAVFRIPVFRCNWLEILIYWLPMFIIQNICIHIVGNNRISLKWSNIYEMSVMPFLLIPIIKETLGMSKKRFKVTNKSNNNNESNKSLVKIIPFLILIGLSIFGIIRIITILSMENMFGMVVILFWLFVNLYSLIMVIFLIMGRESSEENESVVVKIYEDIKIQKDDGVEYNVTTYSLMEHSIKIFHNDINFLKIGENISIILEILKYKAVVQGVVSNIHRICNSDQYIITILIMNCDNEYEYLQMLYDRVPTLPNFIQKDFFLYLLWRNITFRIFQLLKYILVEIPIFYNSKSARKQNQSKTSNIVVL